MSNVTSALSVDQIAANFSAADAEFKQAVEDRIYRAADEAGLLGDEGSIDPDLIEERAYQEIKTKHVVSIDEGNDDRYDPDTSSSKQELAAAVFTAGPTPADAERNAVEKKAYEKCLSLVWNHTVMSSRGRIQKRLAAEKLLLVRGNVYRNGNTIETGVFVTRNPELILREYLGPRLDKWRKEAEALKSDFDLAVERDKSLAGPLQAAIQAGLAEAGAKLPVGSIGSGQSNGTKALDE